MTRPVTKAPVASQKFAAEDGLPDVPVNLNDSRTDLGLCIKLEYVSGVGLDLYI